MGAFLYPITIRNLRTEESMTLEAIVDSGATFTTVAGSLLEQIRVPIARHATMQLADGSLVDTPLGFVEVLVNSESTPTVCLFGKEGSPVILGSTTLQALLLSPDVVNHRLVKTPGLLVSSREASPEQEAF